MKFLHLFLVSALIGISFLPHVTQAAVVHQDRICSMVKKPGLANCHAHALTDVRGNPLVSKFPQGFTPQQLREAYRLSGLAPGREVVAIVDAYDDPTIKKDLDSFSGQFGLKSLPDCRVSIGKSTTPCFSKINERGKTAVPKVNGGWAMEIALDVEAVHALCENCSILLVEADSPNLKHLLPAEDMAVRAGANVISNSWGGPEFASEIKLDAHFDHEGVAITASSGDSGFGVQYPAASRFVAAVGGTSLYLSGGQYKNEDAWSGAGSGCSQFEPKPSWQTDAKCSGRTVADVSAVADPSTGMAVYTTTSLSGQKGWFTLGGTSLAAPIIAAVYALSANIPAGQGANRLPYDLGSRANLHDIVGGSNGDCAIAYLCQGKSKYDGPTGLGSPKGTGAF
jgi:subtilase family serine protease